MLTSTRLPSGGTIFASSRAVAGQDRGHLRGADVARLGHVDDHVGHAERDASAARSGRPPGSQTAAHPLPVELLAQARAAARRAAPPGRSTSAGRRPGGGGCFGAGRRRAPLDGVDRVAQVRRCALAHRGQDRVGRIIRSSGAATTCGRPVWTARVCRTSPGRRGGPSARWAWSRVHTVSRCPSRASSADRSWRPSLFTGRARTDRAPSGASRAARPFGGGSAPSTYDLTR